MLIKKNVAVYLIISVILFFILLFIVYFMDKLGKIAMPFLIAMIITYIVKPIVNKLEKKNIPCCTGIMLVYSLVIFSTCALIVFIIPELINNSTDFLNAMPNVILKYRDKSDGIFTFIMASKWPEDLQMTLYTEIQDILLSFESYIVNTTKAYLGYFVKTIPILFDLLLAMIISFYFIKDGETFKQGIVELFPRRWRNDIIRVGIEISSIISNFIRGQLLTAVIVGAIEVIALMLLKVRYPIFLGFLGGMLNIVPYFGPIIGAIPAIAIALMDSQVKALWTLVVFFIIQQVDNAFISPKIIEGKLGLHPLTTIFAVVAGGEFFGIIGMVFSVPVFAIFKVIFKRMVEIIV